MHETVTGPSPQLIPAPTTNGMPTNAPLRTAPLANKSFPPNRSLSKTTHVGNVQIRVLLPTMAQPITFSAVPFKQYTKLPQHRPPLRRDKPVRISLPDSPPRYIFPAVERSFIFIPR